MKKIFKTLLALMLLLSFASCSSVNEIKNVFKSETSYNNIVATFVTTQGNVNFYLYPEAAPVTVANFINLAKRGFYDDTKFTRTVENFVIQGGDPTGTGFGGPGYTIPDEISNWLDFYQSGMLAMANAGPNTAGSQFFFTFYPADWLNGLHAIFGEVKSDADYNRMRKLEVGDVIKEIRFEGDIDLILSLHKNSIDEWNAILDREYPNLKKYPVKEATPEQISAYNEEIQRLYTKQETKKDKSFEYPAPKIIRGIFNRIGKYKPRDPVITK